MAVAQSQLRYNRFDARCARFDFTVDKAALCAMRSNTRVVVTPQGGVPRDAPFRICSDAGCTHVVVPMRVTAPGEYRYAVTYAGVGKEQTHAGVVIVYRTKRELGMT